MTNINKLLACMSLTVVCFAAASSAAYANVAGHVQFISGKVQITDQAGQIHPAQKGDAINEGDTLTSAQKSSAQIKMQDGGFVAVRPDTKLKFDEFVFAGKEDGSEKSFFSLFKGGFRAVTGLIGRINKHNYRITTPAATIGIRGTDHETFLITPDSPLAQLAPAGAYNRVNIGETSMTTDMGTIIVQPNQMGFAGGMDQTPQLQPVNINLFTVVEAPAPENEPEKKEENANDGNQASGASEGASGETKTETAADGGSTGETAQETTTAAAPQEETVAPVRTASVVDATAPSTGGAPAATAPAAPTTTAPQVVAPPPAPTTIISTAPVAGGTTVNITTGTATTSTGQTIPVIQGLYATQAQTAANAATAAANAAATAAAAVATANTTLASLLPVDTAPASTAITTASPLVTGAATTYATASAITPVATTSASTAVATATASVNTAVTAVTAANALAPVVTTPADTAIATANTGIGAASTAVTTANGLAPVATTPADTAIATANANIGTASTAVITANGLTPANAALAIANATTAQTAATAAAAQVATAQTALANSGAFADATAAPALTAAQNANAVLQPANGTVQGAVTTVGTNNTALTAAQATAQNALTTANNNLTTASNNLAAATTQNTALTAAQLAAQNALATAQSNVATANSNLATATTQNTALTAAQLAAQNALATAQTSLATANSNLTTATTQNASLTAAQTAAQTALTTAQTSLTTANNNLTTATNQNTAIAAAQAAAPAQLTAAQTAAQNAQAAAVAAQAAAAQATTLQAAGDLAGAQAQLTITQQQLTIAQQQQAIATAAQTAVTTSLTGAQTARTTGQTSVTNAVAAAGTAQTNAATVTTQSALIQPAATAAGTAVAAVIPAANTAATDAGTASTQAAAAQTAAGTAGTAVTTATTAANTAATDATTAQTQAGAAQTAASTASIAVTDATTAANTAATDAGTAQTQAAAAQTASSAATAALTASTTNLTVVNTNATTVATNAPIAAYNNPAVVTPDRFVGISKSVVPSGGGYIEGYGPGAGFTGVGTANTSFVLDGAGNLVESRHTWYEETAASTPTPVQVVPDANLKISGGTAAETFKLADYSIYAGRWLGGTITVTDNAAVVSPITHNLGGTSYHWAILLAPSAGYVQALTGPTTYTKVGSTSPTDALGNVGTLNSATLSADFTAQLVSATLNLGIAAKTLNVVAANMAMNGSSFNADFPVVTCTGCGTTYYGYIGGGFAGDAAASAGLNYTLWTGAAPGATTPATDLIHGIVAFTAATPPTLQAFGVAAQAAADAALAAANAAVAAAAAAGVADTTLAGIAPVSTTPASTAIATANGAIGTALPLVSSATALTPADAAAATTNAAAAQTAADAAAAQAAAAATALAANATFADSTAVTANNQINAPTTGAAALVQSANASVQTAAATILPTENNALTTAQTAASGALNSANTNLGAANTSLTTANVQNTAIATAQGLTATPLTAAQTAAANAQTAANAAQTAATQAATLQGLGDLAGAQAQLVIAQQQLAIAQSEQAAAIAAQTAVNTQLTNAQNAQTAAGNAVTVAQNAANTAAADAGTGATGAQTYASAAQTAAANATAALLQTVAVATGTAANTVQNQAAVVAANAPIAAYNNPAVTGDFIAAAMFPIATGGGTFNEGFAPSTPLQPNTAYVLDGSGNLVEARNLPFQVQANQNGNVLTPVITGASGADIKWSGGTAADTFKLSDNSIYAGRWMGATVTVTDNAIPANVYTYTPAASLWMVLLPPPANYVPTLVGTVTYNEAGNTTPVDAFGNLGVFGGATLVANFTSQVVNAAVSLTMSAPSSMAGTFSVSGTAMPIDALGGFGVPNASYLITTCTAGTCAAGAGGYSADMGGSFAGALAASIGMSYNIWPTTATSADPATNSVQGLVAFTTGTAPTAPVNPAAGVYGRGFMIPNTIAGGYNTGRPYITPAAPNTSILLDGSGNLVTLLGTTYEEPGGPPGSPNPPTVAISNANITWSGGTAAERYQSVSGDVVFGRWQGGSVTVTDLSVVTPLAPFTVDLAQTGGMVGPTSNLWAYASGPANGFVQSLTGTTTYTRTDWTTPFDSQGGMGVLNSASLSANFTNQLVSTVLNLTMNTGPLAGNTFNVAGNMPINPPIAPDSNSFKSVALPIVTCSGGPCNPGAGGSFMAEMRGAFAGATVVDAILGYAVWNETPTAPSDIIYGYVAFNTATPPTVNPAGPLAAYSAINTSVAYTGAYGGAFNFTAAPGDISPAGNPTTFTERYGDGSGFRSDTLAGATTTTPPTNMLTPGGTPITYGVWETVASVATTEQHRIEPGMSGTLPVYMYGAEGYLDSAVVTGVNTGPMTGVFNYTSVATTSFESDTWATGSVTTSTMSANFTAQTVNVALVGTMGANNWGLASGAMPITFQNSTNGANAQFFTSAPTLTLNTVACPTCVGNINGTFVGQNYTGAIVQYGFYDNNGAQGMNAGGLVAFSQDAPVTPGTPAPTGAFAVVGSWQVGSQTTITTSGGVLTGWSSPGFGSTVAPAAGSVAQTAVGTGSGLINWGTWGAGSVAASTFSYNPGLGQFHWITAPEPTPVYLAEVLTTPNAVYSYVGGDVTSMDMLGGWARGTISGTTSITANFTTQTVAVALAATVNTHNWLASATNVPLQYLSNGNSLTGFNADSYRLPSDPGYLAVTVDGAGANGNLAGQLVGAALDGAIIKFNLDGQVTTPTLGYEYVQGTAALGAAVPNDPATPYRMVVTSISDPMALVPTVMISGSYNNATRVLTNGPGYLTQFDNSSGGGRGETIQYVSGTFVDQASVVIGGGTVSWGRWDAGTVINVQDRATGTWQNGIVLTGGAHAVVGPIMTGPVALPTTGVYGYTLAGNTLPTDGTGVAGTLNSASLSANFTAQTVDVGVNVTAGSATLNAAATSVPIQNRANFSTNSMMTGPGALVVTCSGTCGTTNQGMIGGGFGGPGGVAAAITYGFEKRGVNAGTVSGVAVFQQGAVIP